MTLSHYQTVLDQVCNLQNTIKVACDLVSIHNVAHITGLIPGQRVHRIRHDRADDVLQLRTLLWYASLSVSSFEVHNTTLRKSSRE